MENKKYPFTETGLQDLMLHLYSLPETELETEADNLLKDIKSWAIAHFDFEADQIDYLNNLDEQTLTFMAYTTYFALINQLPVTLQKQDKKDEPVIKIIETKNKIAVMSANDETSEASGEVIIKVYYA
ncbi:hypothetical protein DBR11_28935 [Pedobacter sp. HMWF019]|uniref:hypothetical protein n=1 Tax=Pedobacter sp. HMWF019 TaxID=2056856 RepID=UPI000D3C4B94|nr:MULTISPECIES: hypothetical protein [unclassified Pedobacter]PTS91490.1 hypothetical protein DBR11_28935 [Pedobacter sp. HMWF019]